MAKNKEKEQLVKIKLPRIGNKDEAVYVSVGDRSWRIRRGDEVEIPLCAYDLLRNAQLAEDAAVAYIRGLTN